MKCSKLKEGSGAKSDVQSILTDDQKQKHGSWTYTWRDNTPCPLSSKKWTQQLLSRNWICQQKQQTCTHETIKQCIFFGIGQYLLLWMDLCQAFFLFVHAQLPLLSSFWSWFSVLISSNCAVFFSNFTCIVQFKLDVFFICNYHTVHMYI